jgi:hypothetical protein
MRYFMSYATANDTDFFADFMNFKRLSRSDPGVSRIELAISVSEVRPASKYDYKTVKKLAALAKKNRKINCEFTKFKSNIGRDFSSAEAALAYMLNKGSDEDYALFVNRSGYGPFKKNWYSAYIDLLNQTHSHLVGTSINFCGHSQGKTRGLAPHVQTYVYFAKLGTLRPLLGNYPGKDKVDRLELIEAGEIGLSSWIMNNGGSIACLAWPEKAFSSTLDQSEVPYWKDIKKEIEGFPFLYKRDLEKQNYGKFLFDMWKRI